MKIILLTLFAFFFIGCGEAESDKQDVHDIVHDINDSSKFIDTNSSNSSKLKKDNLVYGQLSNKDVKKIYSNDVTIYMPEVSSFDKKLPFILFLPGWGSSNGDDYKTLLNFVASKGYIVLYVPSFQEYSSGSSIDLFLDALQNKTIKDMIDKDKFGVIGHSSGGGLSFYVLKYFYDLEYGKGARFVFAMDPWFSFEMRDEDFKNFPKDTKVVIQQYGKYSATDPRIALTIYNELSNISEVNRDYQVYETLNHGSPIGEKSISQMQLILKPLDALMDFTFYNNKKGYAPSLELGSDVPYKDGLQKVLEKGSYSYNCYAEIGDDNLNKVLIKYGIDYCKIIP